MKCYTRKEKGPPQMSHDKRLRSVTAKKPGYLTDKSITHLSTISLLLSTLGRPQTTLSAQLSNTETRNPNTLYLSGNRTEDGPETTKTVYTFVNYLGKIFQLNNITTVVILTIVPISTSHQIRSITPIEI